MAVFFSCWFFMFGGAAWSGSPFQNTLLAAPLRGPAHNHRLWSLSCRMKLRFISARLSPCGAWAPPSMAPHSFGKDYLTTPPDFSVRPALHGVWASVWGCPSETVRSHGWRSRAYTDVFTACFGRAPPHACLHRGQNLNQRWGSTGAFQPRPKPIQSSRRKCARAVAMGWERDFCQAVIITLATRLPWRVRRHSA